MATATNTQTVTAASSTSSLDSEGSNRSKTNDETATEMCLEFSKFLNLNVDKEERKFNDSVEIMLAKLEEFFSLVDMIRSDTTLCLSTTVPTIQNKCSEMETIFEKIDKLEDLVSLVQACVSATEEKVSKAEDDMGGGGLVKKLAAFNFLKKSPTPAPAKKTEYVPVNIFSTEQFFDQEAIAASPSPSQDEAPSASDLT